MTVPPEHRQQPLRRADAPPRGVYREPWAVSPSTTTIFHVVTRAGDVLEMYVPASLVARADALVESFLSELDPQPNVRPALKIVG